MLFCVQLLIVETPSPTNTVSLPVSIILGVVFGIRALLFLFIFAILVVWLCLRKLKLKESLEVTYEPLTPLAAICEVSDSCEDSDSLLPNNFHLSVCQDMAIATADDVCQFSDTRITENVLLL